MKRGFFTPISRLALLAAAVAIPSGFCFAWYGAHGGQSIGYTRYMWSRTWHAQNSLESPLNPYFVPRAPGYCGSGGRTAGIDGQCGVTMVAGGQYGASPYSADALTGFEPVQFERLGQVANELDIIGNVGSGGHPQAAPAAPIGR